MSVESQNSQILQHLKAGQSITPLEALDKYGCLRLGARIYDLKSEMGVEIDREMVKDEETQKRFARYRIKKPA